MKREKLLSLVECAIMVALSTVLSMVTIGLPYGGGVTLFSAVPLLVVSYRHGFKYGIFTAFVASLIQLILGVSNVLYCTTLAAQIGCILLDYVLAFSAYGLASVVSKPFGGTRILGLIAGAAITTILRFICSFLSGILLWGGYAPEGTPVWIYSLTYNGSYMLPEGIISIIGLIAVWKILPKKKA